MSEYPTFGEMTKEERSELVEAELAGVSIERMENGAWVKLLRSTNQVLFFANICYRIAPTKPSIDWSHVHPNYKYLATDSDGDSYLYPRRPEFDGFDWLCIGDAGWASVVISFKPGTCKPEDSLVMRPEGV